MSLNHIHGTIPSQSSQSSLWIASPRKDGFFFFASALSVALAWAATDLMRIDSRVLLMIVGVLANGPHLASTWSRVYFDSREWRARPQDLILIPALIGATVFTLAFSEDPLGRKLLNTILLYWATWHFAAQNWGLLRIYQQKSGEPRHSVALRLEKPLLFLWAFSCLLHRMSSGPRDLFGVEPFYLPLPVEWVRLLWIPIVGMGFQLVYLRLRDRNVPWARASWLRLGFLLAAFVGFAVPFLLMTSDGTAAFAAAACWHGIQYLGIMHIYHQNTWKTGIHPQAPWVSWLAQPGWERSVLYALFLLGLIGVVYGIALVGASLQGRDAWTQYRWTSALWLSLTFSHYWIDGVIWKFSRSPELARSVGAIP